MNIIITRALVTRYYRSWLQTTCHASQAGK